MTMREILHEHRARFAWASLLIIIGTGFGLMQPLVAGQVVSTVQLRESAWPAIWTLVGIFVVQVVTETLGRYHLEVTGEETARSLRRRVVVRALHARLETLSAYRSGDLISRIVGDPSAFQGAVTHGYLDMAIGILTLVGAALLMAAISPLLLITVVAIIAIAALGAGIFLSQLQAVATKKQAEIASLTADLESVLIAVRTVKTSNAELRESERLSRSVQRVLDAARRGAGLTAAATPSIYLAATGSLIAVVVIGGSQVADGSLSTSELVSALLYSTYIVVPLGGIVEGYTSVAAGRASLRRISEIVSLEAEYEYGEPSTMQGPADERTDHPVVFDRVDFSYAATAPPVLRSASIKVQRGSRCLIVGSSGSGKSTVLNLMCGLYVPQAGSISTLGSTPSGQDLRQLRSKIALVEQNSPVLHGTAREAVSYAVPQISDAEILRILSSVGLDGVFPDSCSLNRDLGDLGATLSGGERQRIALARGLAVRPDLLLLDEPTSSLDTRSFESVMASIAALPRDVTVVMVSHDYRQLEWADSIIEIRDGGLVWKT